MCIFLGWLCATNLDAGGHHLGQGHVVNAVYLGVNACLTGERGANRILQYSCIMWLIE